MYYVLSSTAMAMVCLGNVLLCFRATTPRTHMISPLRQRGRHVGKTVDNSIDIQQRMIHEYRVK
jgi:hypothetical protein